MSMNICLVCSLLYITPFTCLAYPILEREGNDIQETGTTIWSNSCLGIIVGLLSTICLILTVGICVCCGKNKYFKWPRRHPRRVLRSNFGNGISGCHEISIFPPPGIEQYLSASTSNICFEPLPDITSQLDGNHPSRLSSSVASNLNEEWFAEPHKNFPRTQLQYVRKLGSGWFGQVLEGRAIGVDTDHTSTVITKGLTSKSTPVVVKSLREDASQKEQAFFLQELMPYRDLQHKNVLKIVAYCLETQPLLVLLQCCPKGDLKRFLKKATSVSEVTLLKMAEDAAQGLTHMHEHNFIHTDLAARNCLVDEDLTVKIGDYGFSLEIYQDDYYLAENVALPLRWCAPETLHCTDTTIEARELTTSANVWSFGVVLWEIFSRGRLPYEELDEDGIIQKVILERFQVLQNPQKSFGTKLDEIFCLCFEAVEKRPAMPYVCSLLSNLSKCLEETTEKEFEGRWNQLSQEQMQNKHNVMAANNALDMKFESDFSPIDEKSSPTASLKNFHGSADDLDARIAAKFGSAIPSWLGLEPGQTMDSFTEEISDAIQRLDEALSEDRSESTTSVSSPEKGSLNFRLGKNSLVLNPPLPSRTLSDGEEENLTMRLEQGDFSELVRLKSQSVQDFMRLTVVDDGSDSSDKASQPGSFVGDYPSVHHSTQDKNFSSESNLKEAVRDAGFMVELEKLQAEHKFSIISEASREGMSSIEDANRHGMSSIEDGSRQGITSLEDSNQHEMTSLKDPSKLAMSSIGNTSPYSEIQPKDYTADESMANNNSFLGSDFPSSKMEGRKSILQKEEFKTENIFDTQQKGEISPDCVVSSRGALSAPLPDIISHDGNVKMSTSSDSLLDEDKIYVSNVQNSTLSTIDGDSNAQDNDSVKTSGVYSFDKEGSKDDITDPTCTEALLSSDNDIKHTPVHNTNVNYLADNIVIGQDVIIGALEDYSLEFYKPVKSVDNFSSYQNILSTDNCKGDLNHNVNETRDDETSDFDRFPLEPGIKLTNDNDNEKEIGKDTLTGISPAGDCTKEEVFESTNSENSFENDAVLVGTNVQDNTDIESPNYPNDINSFNSNIIEFSNSSESFIHVKKDSKNENDLNCNSNMCNAKILQSSTNEESTGEKSSYDCERKENSSIDSENLKSGISSQDSVRKSCTESQNVENGEFWELQMAAWQEAAEQTRELLYEAAHPPDSEDDLLDLSKSPESLHKSPFSSTDRLDDSDDEGTYVSYDAGEDDVVRFNSDDIAALRSELSLKLRDVSDQPPPYSEVENEKDMIFINYKNGCPSTLSPIKEEAGMDFEMYPSSESSYDFADINQIEENDQMDKPPVSPESLRISLPCHDNDGENSYDVCKDEARDSLILEDLEYDGSPQQAIVIGPLAPSGSSEDLLLVDTLTNKVTLVDSGRPQSHIAFLVEGEHSNEDVKFLKDENTENEKFDDDDVDYESLPYEDPPSQVSSFQISRETCENDLQLSSFQISKETCVNDLPVIRNVDENEAPHYQSYFTSAVSSIHPTPSLDGNDAFESAEHISLPYDVNLPVMKIPDEKVKPGHTLGEILKSESKRKFSSDSEKEAVILDDPSVENSFVTLSFLGRLYSDDAEENKEEEGESLGRFNSVVEDSQNSSMEHYYSTKSDDDSSDNEDIEELLPESSTPQHDEELTPKRTPSRLADFVWRGEQPDERYTPDWESDSDGNEDMESSSTSGEFIWQPGDSSSNTAMCIPSVDKTSLEWQMANEKVEEPSIPVPAEEEQDDDDDDGSESGEEEFTPSTWNCELTPQRSLLKSPESSGGKKSVHWKRQRHHRVYEYPPEPQSWHAEITTNPTTRRSWGSSHSLDYLTLADWELGGDEFLDDNCEDFEEFFPKGRRQISAPQIYSLAPFAYDKPPEDLFSNSCEFFMGSPGSSYAFSRSSFTPADFFPSQNPNNYNYFDESNVKSGDEPPESYDVPDSKQGPEESKLSREKLRLDLPTLCLAESQTPGSERQNFSL